MSTLAVHDYNAPIYERGIITAPKEFHNLISAHVPRAYKMRSYDNSTASKTAKLLHELAQANGYALESIFDARHGRRYMCFAYRLGQRKALWDYHTGAAATV